MVADGFGWSQVVVGCFGWLVVDEVNWCWLFLVAAAGLGWSWVF